MIVNAFLFIGLDLSSRDKLHDAWGKNHLWLKMALLIGAGGFLSWVMNRDAGQIALASTMAFVFSGTADALVYHWLKRKVYLLRVNGSNVVGAFVDSIAFPTLAFGWPPMWGIVAGQFIAKVFGGFIWSLILKRLK